MGRFESVRSTFFYCLILLTFTFRMAKEGERRYNAINPMTEADFLSLFETNGAAVNPLLARNFLTYRDPRFLPNLHRAFNHDYFTF